MSNTLGLYLHIPFCLRKCGYCDFYSVTTTDLKERFVDTLCAEIQGAAKEIKMPVDTVFFGGGTPSLLAPDEMEKIFVALNGFSILPDAEISMEVNPATVTPESLRAYRACGINRVSVGMQSANEQELNWLGRIHTHTQTERTVRDLISAGFDNFNLDLIYGLEGQKAEDFLRSVSAAIKLDPAHLSLYALTLSEGVPLYPRKAYLSSDEEQEKTYLLACETLERAGLNQYEISNFARPGRECAHNLKYWTRAPYLGFGPGASSFYHNRRYTADADLNAYLRSSPDPVGRIVSEEPLTDADALCETLMLSLRLNRGLDVREFQKALPNPQGFQKEIETLCALGLARISENILTLKRNGCFVSNEILARLLVAAGL